MSFVATAWGFSDLADDWRKHGKCRDEDPELFFPIGTRSPARAQIDRAKAVCYRCPVRRECLEWAVDRPQTEGVWGGTSVRERQLIRRRRRQEVAS